MATREYYADLDLKLNEIKNVVVEAVSSAPTTSTKQGQIVSYQGSLYVAKTETEPNSGVYTFVELAQGGDLTGLTSRVDDLESEIGSATYTGDSITAAVNALQTGKVDKLSTKPTAGTYTKVTINAEGQVSAGANIEKSDITSLLDAGDGTYLAKNGTAAEASKITGATIALSTGVTGTATNFTGEAAITIPVTAINADYISSGEVAVARLPTGNAASKIVELGTVIGTNEAVVWDGSKFAGKNIASVYNVKGSVPNYTALTEITTKAVGDVYNVVAANGTTPAGTNYVWTGTAWDALGGSIETSGFEDITNKVVSETFNGSGYTGSDTGYPTTKAVVDALSTKLDANAAITGATKCKITYDANGLVTSGADLAASDIPNIEESQVIGLAADLESKQDAITGAATSIVDNDLTSDKALISSSSGKVATSSVTATELGYVSGVTSAIQTQIDNKVAKNADLASAGTSFSLVKYDVKGLVTAGKTLDASDIPNLAASQITSGTFDVARIPDISYTKVTGFDGQVKSVMAAQFVDTTLSAATASGNTYTITTATKPYGVMVLKGGVQVFTDIEITATSIIVKFNTAITPADFTVSYILKTSA